MVMLHSAPLEWPTMIESARASRGAIAEGMWDFLRAQFSHAPRPLRPLFVIAFLLAGLNRLNKIEYQPQLEECLAQPGMVGCIGLGIAASPYAVLALGLLFLVLFSIASRIRRWLISRRSEKLLDR